MADKGFKRKLTAILSADVEGYSRLMGEDEEATIRTLTSYRSAMAKLVQQYRGRVVDSPGDNILSEFVSAVDAVNCAVEIQRELAERNACLPSNRRMEFRIGVNVGDIVQVEERIYGDGVNIAARVEGLADAGGICISGRAFDQVANKLGLEYESLGEHQVKNINAPIRIYRVLSYPGAAAHRVIKAKKNLKKNFLRAIASIVLILLIIFTTLYWKYYYLPTPVEIDPQDKMNFELSQGPTIAVLPLANMSGDPEQEYFCDGISDNIISALAHVRQLLVIARNSSFSYKGNSVRIQQIGHELGVQYLIKGSIQKSENGIRITVQLVETASGDHIWSEIYDRKLEDILKLQDEITIDIVKASRINISDGGEQIRNLYEGIDNLQIFIKCLKFRKYFNRFNREGNDLARKEILEIIELDNQIPLVYAWLGFVYLHDIYYGACGSPIICFGQATEAARKALSLDANNYKAHQLAGYIFLMRKEYEKAINELKRSITINPNCADCYVNLGQTLCSFDRPHEGIDFIKKAFLLNPKPPSFYYTNLGYAFLFAKENEKALETFRKGSVIEPNDIFARIGLSAVYATLDRVKEARTEKSQVLKIDPTFTIDKFIKNLPIKDNATLKHIIEKTKTAWQD